MSTKLLVCVLLCLCTHGFSQKSQVVKGPPGTIQVNDTLFVDETEIGNVHWREYMNFLMYVSKDTEAYYKAMPDTTVWAADTLYSRMSEYYFRHAVFNTYPVVGITYQNAVDFCKWRTFAANIADYFREHNIRDWNAHINDSFPIRYYYRLPTANEWEMIATGNMNKEKFPYGYDSTYRKEKKEFREVFNCIYPTPSKATQGFYTTPGKSYFCNSSGVYNMIGNVAEMVSDEGIAKGGSFVDTLDNCKISSKQCYKKPERWLGFRCVAVKLQ